MAESDEQMPTFIEFFSGVNLAFNEFGLKWDKYPPNYPAIKKRFLAITLQDTLLVFAMAVIYTIGRSIFNKTIFLPLGRWLQLRRADLLKFPESIWKLLIYSILWSYCVYIVVLSGRYDFFQRPCNVMNFTLEDLGRPPQDIYILYICQIGFYLHGLYGTMYMDAWRKDSATMMFHHCLTIFLLYFSFSMGYYKIGALVLLLHDISDILLEVTKINVYLKTRGGKVHQLNDFLSTIGFMSFAFSWALCRLYWFPLKVLHASNYGVYKFHLNKDPQMYLPFNAMLFMLEILHIYWFIFILLFLYKVASGQLSDLEDIREYDDDVETEKNNVHANNHHTSNNVKKNL